MKQALINAILEASRENSMAAVFFHSAIAKEVGLYPTDHKALDLLIREGSLSAGEISSCTGLTSASVTSLIDRLEAHGFVQRRRDHKDRRRVIVEPASDGMGELTCHFHSLRNAMNDLLMLYTEGQLETIHDFLVRTSQCLHKERKRLEEETS